MHPALGGGANELLAGGDALRFLRDQLRERYAAGISVCEKSLPLKRSGSFVRKARA